MTVEPGGVLPGTESIEMARSVGQFTSFAREIEAGTDDG